MKFLTAIAVLSLASSASALCTGQALDDVKKCYVDYMHAYNLTQPLAPYWTFHNVRQKWFSDQGVKVQQKVCDIGNALVKCVASHRDCMDILTFDLGMDTDGLEDGYDYIVDLFVTEYQCSPRGLQLALKIFNCMVQCRENGGQDKQDKCKEGIIWDGLTDGICGGASDYMECVGNVYGGCCGPEGAEFMCGTTRAGIEGTYSGCDKDHSLRQCNSSLSKNARSHQLGRFNRALHNVAL